MSIAESLEFLEEHLGLGDHLFHAMKFWAAQPDANKYAYTAAAAFLGFVFLFGCCRCCCSRRKAAGGDSDPKRGDSDPKLFPGGDKNAKRSEAKEQPSRSLAKQNTMTSKKDVICLMSAAKAIFAEIDDDKSGDIDAKDLEKKLTDDEKAREILKLTVDQIPRFMKEADTDGNGTLNLGEFLAALKKRNLFGNLQPNSNADFADLARGVFDEIDKDKNGSLDAEELKAAYIMMASARGQQPSTKTVKQWVKSKIKKYNKDEQGEGVGTIEFEEFVELFESNGELALLVS
jgi:Ca2+-binding EF-hand superfamily protein